MPKVCTDIYPSPSIYDPIFAQYPYELSDFQKYAIEAIVNGQHVLSCAHTGSGKTLAAEFAIQHFVKKGKKVIYTSPIKALSNQKYYEFTQKYPDITFGLMTGDIKTNPCADVLIMTTEILMNRLFVNNENKDENDSVSVRNYLDFQINLETELACVVFDEVHYINDKDRGHVWEQTIMMLPPHVQMVMLSATIDNPVGFAEWCEKGNINHQDNKIVYLATTDRRVVPLTHYVYFATTEEPFKKIKDKDQHRIIREATNQLLPILTPSAITGANKFHDASYHKIKQMSKLFDKERFFMKRKFVLNHLAEYLRDKEMLPAITFVFSRKHVEQCAHEITANLLEFDSKVAYTMRHECEQIIRKFPNFREYLELPEFNDLVALLEKGIGIHHSGMIPVLREIVEIMISKKHVKMLFATESFAIGLDCPIRTAIFTSLQKYTSEGLRDLYAHEYTQMAGRAGRRGIDTVGNVIHLNNLFREQPDIETYKTILEGKPQKLVSKFHVSYSMVLKNYTLLNDGSKNIEKIVEYANSTIWAKDIESNILSVGTTAKNLALKLEEKKAYLQASEKMVGFVPQHVYTRFAELKQNMALYANKKRKEVERELAGIKDEYKKMDEYAEKYSQLSVLERDYKEELNYLDYLNTLVESQVKKICEILLTDGLLVRSDVEDGCHHSYLLTDLGKIAANIAEIHPILAAKIVEDSAWFDGWTVTDFAIFFACFTQIKVDEEYRRLALPDTIGRKIVSVINLAKEKTDALAEMEQNMGAYTGICYQDMMTYDLAEEIGQWIDCDTEQQCKYFIQTVLAGRGISVGDFTKAVLKIATIAREFAEVCDKFGKISASHTLSKIDASILKYVTTCQSLYV
uniref:Helicase n=1 Tax=viral metagenome TaxID=1070528 RepID=A0A6C0HYP3_9ZZZZ